MRSLVLAVTSLVLVIGPHAPEARADEFVNRVNATFEKIPKDKRSDLIILPVLAKLEAPPAEIRTVIDAVLLLPTSAAWPSVTAWATAEPQKAVLKALADVTSEEDYHVAMVFAQGYGVEAVSDSPDLISAEMFTELGDPPTLATAKFGYMPKMEQLFILANIEASRLMSEGDFVGAIDLMYHALYFAVQLTDRPMLPEMASGLGHIKQCLERVRDIVYQDQRAEKHALDFKDLRRYVDRLDPKKGYMAGERIRLPMGTFVAAEQILNRVLIEKKGVNEATFASVLARIAAKDRPLRVLSESAYWETVRPLHEGWYSSMDMLIGRDKTGGLVYDWTKRWNLSPHDSLVKLPSDYKRHVAEGPRFAALRTVLDGVEELFQQRLAVLTEVVGTRMSLAVYGYYRAHNQSFPPTISAIRPEYVQAVDKDPYSVAGRPIVAFVPIRDNIPPQNERADPSPWMVHCYPPKPYKSFVVPLRADTFVLFSVGPDDDSVNAKDATQDDADIEGDYLLWPPMISLIRQHLIDTGGTK